jgi:ribosomal protein S18 acetylase RimI-like enzyme
VFKTRKAGKDDIGLIRTLCLQVWPQTYGPLLSQGQIEYMLELMYSTSSLEKQFDKGAEFIVLYDDETPIGYTSIEEIDPAVFKLQKIYILPSFQGKGMGRKTIDEITRMISERGARTLQLQVFKRNKARHFYENLGFKVIEELELDIGEGYIMDDYIMEKSVGDPSLP